MESRITVKDLTNLHSIIDDIFERRVDPNNVVHWRLDNFDKILECKIRLESMINKLDSIHVKIVS